MIRFGHVDPEVLRRINLELLDGPTEYIEVHEDVDDPAVLRAKINNLPTKSVQEPLLWMGEMPLERFELAWSKFMAGNIAQQMWPDGNHRTSFLFLNELARAYFGETFSLPAQDMKTLLAGSKALLQVQPRLPGTPVFALDELDDPEHPYRRHFATFPERLQWKSADPSSS